VTGWRLIRALGFLNRSLDRHARVVMLGLAAFGVVVIGAVDYFSGQEISASVSFFYLGPFALAAWYVGRFAGVAISLIFGVGWYIADIVSDSQYSHHTIPIWNAFIRFAFCLVMSLLLTALRASSLHQRHLAETDGLTELYGRRAFENRLEHDLALAQRHKSAVTLAYLDLNNFKAVNDTYGHNEGDRVLRTTGRVLKDSVRLADTAARIGGDEFALVLPDTDNLGAQQVIANLARGLQKALTSSKLEVGFSIGVVTFLNPDLSVARAVDAADAVMYEVKRKGKGTVAFSVLGGAVPPDAPAAAPQTARH
jgi:diguanylate cyclase (GGDEF)-like protein